MAKLKNLKPIPVDLKKELQDTADERKATIISLVAPHGVRTSPIGYMSASIQESEIYRLEKIVDEAVAKGATEALDLIIHTPGGDMHASYKIAHFLRSKFKTIRAFVPYEAASGGTVLCCAANEVYISELGNLTSFDPQVRYKDTRVSAYAFIRAADYIKEEFGDLSPDEIPPPWQQMSQKLDPVIYDEMSTTMLTAAICGYRLMLKSGYKADRAAEIAFRMTRNNYTHSMPIFAAEAKEFGLEVKDGDKKVMQLYQRLVSDRLQQSFPLHAIDAVYPVIKLSRVRAKKKK